MESGELRHSHRADETTSYDCAVISISTSKFEKFGSVKKPEEAQDDSGRIIIELLQDAGHTLRFYYLISDEIPQIRRKVHRLINRVDVIISTGGTGLAPRDVTIEAVQSLIQKEMPGFGELFRGMSYEQVGSAAILTRAIGGIIERTVVFCLPGSPRAVKLAMESLILPELHHILKHVVEN
ncbi:MAG TPA: molybdenum cofactor biosynthesis protein B [Candidatus Acidoferrales bacterium]|nr:molybdenum cofactor biosynthesis protein B [Candidatus Acidoferrales bacterium]